jgi:NMD protein affecting ribosome stability and mRNA decay
MKEAFCCKCGKTGEWPVCSDCDSGTSEPGSKEKKVKQVKEHHPEYFEAIIQNRAKPRAEIEKQILKVTSKQQEKRKFNFWKKEQDFYFGDVKSAKIVARSLVKTFNLLLSESRKQTGYDRHKGKQKFKWNICLRNKD